MYRLLLYPLRRQPIGLDYIAISKKKAIDYLKVAGDTTDAELVTVDCTGER